MVLWTLCVQPGHQFFWYTGETKGRMLTGVGPPGLQHPEVPSAVLPKRDRVMVVGQNSISSHSWLLEIRVISQASESQTHSEQVGLSVIACLCPESFG